MWNNVLPTTSVHFQNRKENMLLLANKCRLLLILIVFRCYLIGKKFKVRTDHSALKWLRTFKKPVGQVARWIERLAEYDFEIVHRPGQRHANADALTRYPHPVFSVTISAQWFSHNLKKEFRKQQEKDAITSTLIQWLKKTSRPGADQMEGVGRDLKY